MYIHKGMYICTYVYVHIYTYINFYISRLLLYIYSLYTHTHDMRIFHITILQLSPSQKLAGSAQTPQREPGKKTGK